MIAAHIRSVASPGVTLTVGAASAPLLDTTVELMGAVVSAPVTRRTAIPKESDVALVVPVIVMEPPVETTVRHTPISKRFAVTGDPTATHVCPPVSLGVFSVDEACRRWNVQISKSPADTESADEVETELAETAVPVTAVPAGVGAI